MEKEIHTIYDIIKKYDKIELTDRETQLGCDEINIIVDTLKDAISTLKTCVTEDKLNDIKQDLKDYIDQNTNGGYLFAPDDDDNPLTNGETETSKQDYPDISDILNQN